MVASTVLAACLLLLLQVALVVVFAAARPRGNIYMTVIAVSFVTAPVAWLAAPSFFGPAVDLDGRLFLVVMHLALGGFFFHFMTLPDRSVTLRILVELLLAPGQTLSVAALKGRYSVKTMIESRVQQLAAGHFIDIGPDGRITLLQRGLMFGRFVTGGRKLFGIASAN